MSASTIEATAAPESGRGESALLEPLRRMFDEGFATGDTAIVDEVCTPDLVEHQFGLASSGEAALAHVRGAIEDVHRMAPDATFTVEDSAISGDVVWLRVRLRGTATGPFFGPPSGPPAGHHHLRPGPRRRRADRRALGCAGPVRRARPDRRARPARSRPVPLTGATGCRPAGRTG